MAWPLLIQGALQVIDKIIPDPDKKMEYKLKIMEMEQNGDFRELDQQLQRDLAQIEVNKEEAKSPGLYKGGWRPFVGWVSGLGLGYQFLFRPIVSWVTKVVAWFMERDLSTFPIPPSLDLETLMTLLFGMLGLGVYRTYEKVKDKA